MRIIHGKVGVIWSDTGAVIPMILCLNFGIGNKPKSPRIALTELSALLFF